MSKVPTDTKLWGPLLKGTVEPQPRLQEALNERDWPRRELAERVGILDESVRGYVKGKVRPRLVVADAICDELQIEWDDLWTYERPELGPGLLVRPLFHSSDGSGCYGVEIQMGEKKGMISLDFARILGERLLDVSGGQR